MELWQVGVMTTHLGDGTGVSVVTGIDDHPRKVSPLLALA